MHITQGTFSYLPPFTDEQIRAQIEYALQNEWSLAIEHTDDPHPRNSYWDMWGQPLFDVADADAVLKELAACKAAEPDHYVKLRAYDRSLGRQTTAFDFIVQPPGRRARLHPRPHRVERSPAAVLDPQLRDAAAAQADARSARGVIPTEESGRVRVADVLRETKIDEVLKALDDELVGLAPVKTRIREIAALLIVDKLRRGYGLETQPPSLHMSFTGSPGTGKTTVALRMAQILHNLGYVRKGHVVSVTRDDLVGQFIGHTAPKTKEMLKRARGGVLFIDEAYYLHRPENERDYGVEAIEILMQVMENERDDIVVILAGYADRMETFFRSNPGMRSRIAHHIDFPDFSAEELFRITKLMLDAQAYRLAPAAEDAFRTYIERRMGQPLFANARSIRNALDRARLRQASRLVQADAIERDDLMTLEASDILASRVFAMGSGPEVEAAR